MLRLKPVNKDINLGTWLDIDGTKYQVAEIHFKTPSDHKVKEYAYELEVQVIHEAISGDLKSSAILCMLYKQKAGKKMPFFDRLDLLSLPNPNTKETDCYSGEFFSVYMFT